jgi:predicted unusual protein kinase regulating ubiquinone biosynthesis (AarF/ABC1/UbiB family)
MLKPSWLAARPRTVARIPPYPCDVAAMNGALRHFRVKLENTVAIRWRAWGRRNRLWRSYRVAALLLRTLYVINRERSRVIRAHERGDEDVRPNLGALLRVLRDFRETAVDLGGLLIKLGQFLGARADLLPGPALEELAGLQDDVPAERFADITAVLEREWGAPIREVCAEIDPVPAGSASLGQVHRARLLDGREVAIKVQRPGIGALVRADLSALRFVLRVVARVSPSANRFTDLRALYREFSRTVAEELDYHREARNAERFAEIFADRGDILVPAVLKDLSTRHVLVLEWMDGIKISQIAALDAASVDRRRLAERLADAYLKQILEVGFFHADPHPGNLLVQPDPEGERLVFLDFGMMGNVTPGMRRALLDCFRGVATANAGLVVRGLDALGFLSEAANRQAIERVIEVMLARFGTAPGARHGPNPREVLGDMDAALYNQPFRLPAQFAYFGRMAGMLLGQTAALSPTFNMLKAATPYAQRFVGGGSGVESILGLLGVDSPQALGRDLLRGGIAVARALADMPVRLDHVLERAERGEIRLLIADADLANGAHDAKARRGLAGALRLPIPIWVPLGLVAAAALTRLARQRTPPGR